MATWSPKTLSSIDTWFQNTVYMDINSASKNSEGSEEHGRESISECLNHCERAGGRKLLLGVGQC